MPSLPVTGLIVLRPEDSTQGRQIAARFAASLRAGFSVEYSLTPPGSIIAQVTGQFGPYDDAESAWTSLVQAAVGDVDHELRSSELGRPHVGLPGQSPAQLPRVHHVGTPIAVTPVQRAAQQPGATRSLMGAVSRVLSPLLHGRGDKPGSPSR